MSGRDKVKQKPMKVVFINTQYVETDARSFKTVVQELTGKDAIVAPGPFESPSTSDIRGYGGGSKIGEDSRRSNGGEVGTTTEFDRFFKEMPPVEELYKLWQNVPEDHSYVSSPPPLVAPIVEPATRSSSPCGLGCEIAALAERQQMVGESSDHNHNVNVSSYNMLPGSF
ncbi:hypothetical protein Bca52824_007170 [Brassica carinata]|uniref:VQ domain-containing protein n=1 Tax=Brassica carinata TaxID=52824 RepID=A0A8X8B7M6_BRACI|nr:hypothetical protein Bca52824_007170 [Brassica carinata]